MDFLLLSFYLKEKITTSLLDFFSSQKNRTKQKFKNGYLL